ncbi:hypothetical protein HQ590_11415 [bacterium]|nr:hypothetical protein [bacterium]
MNRIVLLVSLILGGCVLGNISAQAADPGPTTAPALPAIEVAGSDAQGRITVNGKPFFPILMYDVPTDPASLAMFKAHGFNMVTITKPADADGLLTAGVYGAAHAGYKVTNQDGILFGIGTDSPALYWKDDLAAKAAADLAKVRAEFPKRPVMHAIGYWENEPAGVVSNQVPPKERYEELVKVLDVSAPYLYPIPYQPVATVGEAVARARAATGGKKPLLPILQLFTWEAKDRYPTPAELKCMVYLALINGARGIGYYSYNYVAGKKDTNVAKEQPALWAAVKQINREVQAVGAFLVEALPAPAIKLATADTGVGFRAVRHGKAHLVLLANPMDARREITLKLPAGAKGAWKRLDGGPAVAAADGVLKLTLEPFGVAGLQN